MNEGMSLRPRHILCLLGFKSTWHNDSTAERFEAYQLEILENPQQVIAVVSGVDSICHKCHFYRNGICSRAEGLHEEYIEYDKEICRHIKIEIDKQYRISFLIEQIFKYYKYRESCGFCEQCLFKTRCSWYQSLKTHIQKTFLTKNKYL